MSQEPLQIPDYWKRQEETLKALQNPIQRQNDGTFIVKDSGARIEWETGSKRDTNEGKPRYDLIGRHMLRRLANHMGLGAKKYGEHNWEKGQPVSRSYESALRHLLQWRDGDTSEDHLAAVAFNIGSIIHVQEEVANGRLPVSLIDLE